MLCSRLRTVFAFVCFLSLFTGPAVQAQEDFAVPAPAAFSGDMYRQIVSRHVQTEIGCLKLVADLTDDQADTILDNLDEFIGEESEKIAAELQAGNNYATLGSPKTMADAVAVEAKELLDPDTFKKYESDLALRTKFQRRAGQRGFLVAMDSFLQLSNKQQSVIAKLLMSNWNDDWNSLAVMGSQSGSLSIIGKQIKELPQDKLKTALSESQWAALDGMVNVAPTAMADQVGFAKLQGQAISMLKLEELAELCGLSEQQSGKLKEAADTALEASVERKREAMAALQGGNFQQNMEKVIDISRPIDQMMFTADVWTEAVDQTLSKEQAAKYAARQASRAKRNKTAMTAAAATSFGQQTGGLTGKQQVALFKGVRETSHQVDG